MQDYNLFIREIPSLWEMLFYEKDLSIWACFYCINCEADKYVKKLIKFPKHYFIYVVETEDYVGMDIIKEDNIIASLFNEFIFNVFNPIGLSKNNVSGFNNELVNDINFNSNMVYDLTIEIYKGNVIFEFIMEKGNYIVYEVAY